MEEDASDCGTAVTRISNFTNCTNPTFNKVHRIWKSGSSIQKDVISVLAAVTDVIKEQSGKETEVEYFAALLSTLTSNVDDLNLLSATSYLLSLVVHRVPPGILQRKFGVACQVMVPVIGVLEEDDPTLPSELRQKSYVALRYLVATFGSILAAQPPGTWLEQPITGATFQSLLLGLVSHHKPRVRKALIRATTDIICKIDLPGGLSAPPAVHPAAKILADFVVREIEKHGGSGQNANRTLAVLNLLAPVFHKLPAASVKQLCEILLRLLTLANAVVRLAAYNALYCLFHFKPDDATLSTELCGQLILALYDYQPPGHDDRLAKVWLQCVHAAHGSLGTRDPELMLKSIPKLLEVALAYLKISSRDVEEITVITMIKIFEDCIPPALEKLSDSKFPILNAILVTLADVLKFHNFGIWPEAFKIVASFFSTIGETCAALPAFQGTIQTLVTLRETDSVTFDSELEGALGMAISHVGPGTILRHVSLGVDTKSSHVALDFQRSWFVPLLREFVRSSALAELKTFHDVILPVILKVYQKCTLLEAQGETTELKIYRSLEMQLWDLLPSFCNKPRDIATGLPDLAEIIGNTLISRLDLRMTLLAALRNLLSAAQAQITESLESSDTAEQVVNPDGPPKPVNPDGPPNPVNPDGPPNPMEKYAKNFLPILFRLFTEAVPACPGYDDRGVRLSTLETIRLYLRVANPDLLRTYTTLALGKLDEIPEVMDILIALASNVAPADLQPVFDKAKDLLSDLTQKLKKKPFRILQEILDAGEKYAEFVAQKSDEFMSLLSQDLSKASPASRAARMSTIEAYVTYVSGNDHFLSYASQEAVLGLKDRSSKARKCSARALISIVNTLLTRENTDLDECLELITLWLQDPKFEAAATPQKQASVFVAYRLFTFEYSRQIGSKVVAVWIGDLCKSLSAENRLVVDAALECLITMCGRFYAVTIGQFLDILVPAIYTQTPDCQRHFRFTSRRLLVKLVRKFSAELISKHVPEPHQPQLNYVRRMIARRDRKTEERRSRQSQPKGESDIASLTTMTSWITKPETIGNLLKDSDSEMEDDDVKTTKSSRKMPVWLQETVEKDEDPLDLLDAPKTAGRILTVDPVKSKKRLEKRELEGFKVDKKTGKLIIEDSGDDEKADSDEKATKRPRQDSDSVVGELKRAKMDDELLETSTFKSGKSATFKSGKSAYKPGGAGIHRPRKSEKGDTKRKDGVQPFAYVPLNRSALNKRKRVKTAGQFKSVVKSGKKNR